MKIKVSNTTNIQLDWLVAKCLGWVTYPTDSIEHGDWYHTNAAIAPQGHEHNRIHRKYFSPSTDWAQGGPIIEREEIAAKPSYRDGAILMWEADSNKLNDDEGMEKYGPTPLIAAMRCLVASKLGDEVEVPDELGKQS